MQPAPSRMMAEVRPEVQHLIETVSVDPAQAHGITQVSLLKREIWKPSPRYPEYSVSSLGRVAGLGMLQQCRDRLDQRLFVNLRMLDKSQAKKRISVGEYVETMVFETFILGEDEPLPEPTQIMYMIHLNDNQDDNSSVNLQLASFDEFYAHAERHQTAGQVVERDVRSAEMDPFNPYIHDQNRQPYLKSRYKVNNIGGVKYMDKEESGRTLAMSPDGPLAYLCIRPQQPKGVSVALLVLDSFVGVDKDRRGAIFVDGDVTNARLTDIRHATFEEKREYLIQQLELQNPGEKFQGLDTYGDCSHGGAHDKFSDDYADPNRLHFLQRTRDEGLTLRRGIHNLIEALPMNPEEAGLVNRLALLEGEQWRKVRRNQDYSISNYGRVAGLGIIKVTRTALDKRRCVYLSWRNNKKTKANSESFYVESLVYETYVLAATHPLPTPADILYIIHANDSVHENSAGNVTGATYDNYYRHVERNLPPGSVRQFNL